MGIRNFNIASDDELRNFLLNDLSLSLTKQTKNHQLSVDSEVLESFSSHHPSLGLISKWKTADKLENTYTDSIVNCLDSNNMVHCDFQQIGTIASRLSCRNPNLQNQPTDDNKRAIEYSGVDLEHNGVDPWSIRRAYIIRNNEWPRLYWDYSQIELRVLAYYSQDPIMVQAYLNNEDIHSRTSLEVFGSKEKSFRRLAKVINFGLSYGMTEYHFAVVAGISIEEARGFLNKFFERYKGVKLFRENLWEYIRNNGGYYTNIFGRPRRVPNINSYNLKERSSAERQSIAALIQGSAGELTKESLVRIHKAIISEGLQGMVLPVCTIHDEVQYDCHIDVLPKFCKMVKNIMEDYREFSPIPVIVDSEYTLTNWAEKRELKLAS
jgi:DNA polymerase-1